MNVSGNQKYYLVFKSTNKEIRIPEYDPKGFFEVDKVNGCILFKITKKNAEDILSMKTAGERIFYIIRVFEETDAFGKVLNIRDEVEVYNGKWGDDEAFTTFTTENKADLLTKSLAVQVDKNANLLKEYNDLLNMYNDELKKNSDLEKEIEEIRAERDSLEASLNEYLGDTYNGTLLSTDTKYITFQNTLDNITFTEEQTAQMANDLMTKGEVDLSNIDIDDPRVDIKVEVHDSIIKDLKISFYKDGVSIGSAVYNQNLLKTMNAFHGEKFEFICTGMSGDIPRKLYLEYRPDNEGFAGAVKIEKSPVTLISGSESVVTGIIDYIDKETNAQKEVVGSIGTIYCYIE
jgi:hypothetical protein